MVNRRVRPDYEAQQRRQHGEGPRVMLRDAVFQRCLAVLMHRFIPASQYGEPMIVPGEDDPVFAVSRVVLYAADHPDERRVFGFKLSGCKRPCLLYVVDKQRAACRGPKAGARDVLEHIDLHLDAVEALEDGAGPVRLAQIEGDSSMVRVIPALAAVHGLGTEPCCLYQTFGFDMLHVRPPAIVLRVGGLHADLIRGVYMLQGCDLVHVLLTVRSFIFLLRALSPCFPYR